MKPERTRTARLQRAANQDFLLRRTPRRNLITTICLAVVALMAGRAASAAPRPNIVFFYVDDMGWGSIGPNGQDARRADGLPHVLTPNLDRLAAEGVNFTRAYGCTVCSPARSSLQAGFHQGHTYADRNNTDNARKAMRADDYLIGDALKEAGYVTGYWGKWGYGASSSRDDPEILNVQTLPTSHGYDHVLAELHHVRAHTFFQPTLWSAPAAPGAFGGIELVPNSMAPYIGNPDYPDYPAHQNDPQYPFTAYCDDAYAFSALDFVRTYALNYRATGQPFFGLVGVQVPHSPYDEIAQLPDWDEAYATNAPFATLSAQAKQWAAMVTRIDAHFGNILDALEDPNHDGDTSDSVVHETLVLFQSDNGGPGNNARSEIDANGGLRGSKGSIYEGGIRVPTIMRWPAMVNATSALPAGVDSGLVIDTSDFLPTFCELAGLEPPAGLDGVSLAPTLTGSGHQRHREFLVHEAQPNYSIIRGRHKLVGPSWALYDLEDDPAETTDIASAHPDMVLELRALLLGERVTEAAWFANTYHHWTGGDQADTSDAGNWSDYMYSNAVNGLVYQTDNGPPQPSWTARMINSGTATATANVDADLELLSLAVRGASSNATQTVNVSSNILTGRNEIRMGPHSSLLLDNGSVRSVRWVDLQTDASMTGAGFVDAGLYHAGTIRVTSASPTTEPGPDITIPGPDISLSNNHPYVANGGFELGTDTGGGDYSYQTLENWFTDGPDISKDGAKPNSAYAGTMRGLINGSNPAYPLVQTTPFPFIPGDSYTLTFHHRGFSNWNTGETALARVFYEQADGTRVDLLNASFPMENGTWNQAMYTIPAISDPDAAGREVQVLLGPDTGTGFASLDEVSLVRHGPVTNVPGPGITVPGPDIEVPGHRRLEVRGDYRGFATALLDVALGGTATAGVDYAWVSIEGDAVLDGSLALTVDAGFDPAPGDAFTILTASSVTGTFDNPEGRLLGSDGTHFIITYSPTSVTVRAVNATAQGTPYDWLEEKGLVGTGGDYEAADLLDHDLDGMAAWEEFVAGTEPGDIGSVFALDADPSPGDAHWTVYWPSAVGRIYLVDAGSGPSTWPPFDGPLAATPPENVYALDLTGSGPRCIRVKVSFPL